MQGGPEQKQHYFTYPIVPQLGQTKRSPRKEELWARSHRRGSRNPYLPAPCDLWTPSKQLLSSCPSKTGVSGISKARCQHSELLMAQQLSQGVRKWWEQRSSSMISLRKPQQACLRGEHHPDSTEGRILYCLHSRPGQRCSPWMTFASCTSDVVTGLSLRYEVWNIARMIWRATCDLWVWNPNYRSFGVPFCFPITIKSLSEAKGTSVSLYQRYIV